MSEEYDIDLDNGKVVHDYIGGKNKETMVEVGDNVYAGSFVRRVMHYDSPHFSLGLNTGGGLKKATKYSIDATDMLHTALFGGTGSGKSTLMRNTMVQLAIKGYGFTFIDPKKGTDDDLDDDFPVTIGEDTHMLLRQLPEHRLEDVVYINPIPTGGYSVSVNPIQLPKHTKEGDNFDMEDTIDSKMELLKQIMTAEGDMDSEGEGGGFGAIMERAYEGLFQPMIRSEVDFNFADLHVILNNPDAMDKFYNMMKNELGDDFQIDEAKRVSDLSENELSSLIRRTQRLVTKNRDARDFIVNDITDIDFKELVEQNKIILIDIQSDSKSVINTAIGYGISSLYSSAKVANRSHTEAKEHILFGDEFHKVIPLENAIGLDDILSEGRSQNFLLWYATQSPKRISKFVNKSLTNLGLAITGTIDGDDAKKIASLFIDSDGNEISSAEINQMNPFSYYISKSNYNEPYIPVEGYAPYPPRRSWMEAAYVAGESVRRYGSPHKNRLTFESAVKPFLLGIDVELPTESGLRAIYTAQKFDKHNKPEDMKGFATVDTIEKVIQSSYDVKSDFRFDVWVEQQLNIENVRSSEIAGDVCYRVTSEGKDEMKMDTGKSGSAGKDKHRVMVQNTKNILPKHGIHVEFPTQGGSEDKPDAYGYIFEKIDETPFKDSYDIGEEITMEIEKTTTIASPSKMLKNFKKTSDTIIFISEIEGVIENIEKKITDGGGLGKKTKHGRKAYNKDTILSRGDTYPLRKLTQTDKASDSWTRWFVDDSDTLKLMEKTDTGLTSTATFSPSESFENYELDDFPAHAEKTSKGYVIHDHETGEMHKGYRDIDEINSDTEYNTIKEPYVPSVELDNRPTRDEYHLMLLPDNGNSFDEIQIYYDGGYNTIEEYSKLDKDVYIGDNSKEDTNTDKNKDVTSEPLEDDFDFF